MATTSVNGVTFISSSGSVSMKDVVAAFGSTVNAMSELRSRKWYKSDFTRGNFASSGSLSLSVVRGTGGNIPRISSAERSAYPSATGRYQAAGSWTLPAGFNTITIAVYGASGGGGGNPGVTCNAFNQYLQCIAPVTVSGTNGTAGGSTSLSVGNASLTAPGGGGGNASTGAAGTNGTITPAGTTGQLAGGAGYGKGGDGGIYVYTLNADTNFSAISAMFGKTFTPTYGAAGSGGAGGGNYQPGVNGSNGSGGGVGILIDQNLY